MWVKICANTNLEDATLAVDLGADALGFVFASSPRRVTADQVTEIIAKLPAAVEKIGVFTTLDAEEIAATVRSTGLTGVQFHSDYDSRLIAGVAGLLPDVRLIQTLHRNVGLEREEEDSTTLQQLRDNPVLQAVLVDSRTAKASGGTGIAFDWEVARQSLEVLAPMPLIVAGGLTPGNVAQAISVLRPWGVDVASGVESYPGKKDPEKLAAFLANARENSQRGRD